MTKVCNFKDIKTYTHRYNKRGRNQETMNTHQQETHLGAESSC